MEVKNDESLESYRCNSC